MYSDTVCTQLNQQQNHTKGATSQDYSFLKEASPIYVTSLTGNHVSGTTTVTGTISNLPGSNCISTPSSAATAVSQQQHHHHHQQSTHQVHVHHPPSQIAAAISSTAISSTTTAANKLTTNIQVNPTPLAGGWLIGESAQGTLITTNNQQVFQNLNSINNNNCNSATALAITNTIKNASNNNVLSGNSALNNNNSSNNIQNNTNSVRTNSGSATSASSAVPIAVASTSSSIDASNLAAKYYGNTASTSTGNSELLANGHGPRREVSAVFCSF